MESKEAIEQQRQRYLESARTTNRERARYRRMLTGKSPDPRTKMSTEEFYAKKAAAQKNYRARMRREKLEKEQAEQQERRREIVRRMVRDNVLDSGGSVELKSAHLRHIQASYSDVATNEFLAHEMGISYDEFQNILSRTKPIKT